jgi:hypothetical protein
MMGAFGFFLRSVRGCRTGTAGGLPSTTDKDVLTGPREGHSVGSSRLTAGDDDRFSFWELPKLSLVVGLAFSSDLSPKLVDFTSDFRTEPVLTVELLLHFLEWVSRGFLPDLTVDVGVGVESVEAVLSVLECLLST